MDILKVRKYVEDAYDLHIEFIEKIKSIYKIHTKYHQYCLKVINYDFGHFLFIISAIKHLQNEKFRNIPEIINTKNKKNYIKIGDSYAYLCKWINSRQCDYNNPLDILVATSKLAELHRKSHNFQVTDKMNPRIGWFKWIENFMTRRNEILDFKRRIMNKPHKEEFDVLYLEAMKEEIRMAESSIEHLKASDYINSMKRQIKDGGFCHHDYANHNVLIDDQGEINIIDFDYCMMDTYLHDLASLIIRVMKNGKWRLDNATFIIDAYSAINNVRQEDIPIMAAFMEFPQNYWQIGIQYYWEEQPWGEEHFIKKLNKIFRDRQDRLEFIEEFQNKKI
ncbi:CotS family spore coat protein [Clostridium sp. MT-14]|uniref:CotS family spore coat protein n=1 Tax=Clostridium aromativorans TaxID=2836848 RepID=A0ABS8N4I3_9CLOT|nr:CotS family spore coat protein [Clostridium aromativorans]MCC9293703.1 CotS family spore coat protein [Clostridium aromativorans]